ncbi:hypothetical protein F441_00560 [Phytophthora nicotianae CJ01A1]|uniref:Uncharacterized protein n=3 Tax=Phytophthora nicotianae TaxID=4792 RepID=W2XWF6_PHYNI|nr:hypothetical protein L915_00533 [Phytophthora nicotianae]ETO85822.1 hypothetical protein F444_00556 [Phytophthora nicotianae P1976]ETP26847.1 hypothetical protein F441_00560 [Phytophthora nicotianae CJ01A1]
MPSGGEIAVLQQAPSSVLTFAYARYGSTQETVDGRMIDKWLGPGGPRHRNYVVTPPWWWIVGVVGNGTPAISPRSGEGTGLVRIPIF